MKAIKERLRSGQKGSSSRTMSSQQQRQLSSSGEDDSTLLGSATWAETASPASAASSNPESAAASSSTSSINTRNGDGNGRTIPGSTSIGIDDDTVRQSGNSTRKSTTGGIAGSSSSSSTVRSSRSSKTRSSGLSMEAQLAAAKEQIATEKAGKRKLFHSLVKLANELRRTRNESQPLQEQSDYAAQPWYDGGMWRAPAILPGVQPAAAMPPRLYRRPVSLSDLFFNLVVVTAFSRVGVALSHTGDVTLDAVLYFATFWTVWSKEAAYSTRFDTTDLSAQIVTLVTCFAVLFASLSVQSSINSIDANRVMLCGAFVSVLHCWLHMRVAITMRRQQHEELAATAAAQVTAAVESGMLGPPLPPPEPNTMLTQHVIQYAIFNIIMNASEAAVWIVGFWLVPINWPYRWVVFLVAVVLGLRFPRAFLANDFHAACSKRGVLFILLLGFSLQSIVVVASEFFTYQTPDLAQYAFLGAACLMFYSIKLLYVDDSSDVSRAQDHALLVNRWAGFFFIVGQFALLLSTTVMGSGLYLLTHSYYAAAAALSGPEKNLVVGGFSAVMLSTFLIKSMHVKRIPIDPRNQSLFIAAYVIQSLVLLAVVGVTAAMCYGVDIGFMRYLMTSDIELLFSLSGAALVVVLMSWLDEGMELFLYASLQDAESVRVHPFGVWWCCLQPDVTQDDFDVVDGSDGGAIPMGDTSEQCMTTRGLSELSPLLGSSMANLKAAMMSSRNLYDSTPNLSDIAGGGGTGAKGDVV